MRIANKQTHGKRNIILGSILAIFVVAGVYAWFSPDVPFFGVKSEERAPENTVDYDNATDEQKAAGDKAKQDFISRIDTESKNDNKTSNETSNPVNMTITSTNMNESYLQIRTHIQTLDDDGECTLKLTRMDNSPVVVSVNTQIMGSYSVCKGFDIDTANLAKGEWSAAIQYVGSKSQQAQAEKKVNIE